MHSENGESDRREFKRIAATALVEIHPLDEDIPVESIYAETLNMSVSGIMFATDREFEVGTLWKLKFLLKDSAYFNADWSRRSGVKEQAVPAIARVVWIKGAKEIGFDVAMKLIHIQERHEAALDSFLTNL